MRLFYSSKEATLVGKCQMAALKLEELEVLGLDAVVQAMTEVDTSKISRIIVSDSRANCIYDSGNPQYNKNSYVVLSEVVQALRGNDVFSWQYHNGIMYSRVSVPIYTGDKLAGSLYMLETDPEQGALIKTLQTSILMITLSLEVVIILYSVVSATKFTKRLRRIMASMRIIRAGDYSHKVTMGGNDELTVLANEFNDLTDRLKTSEQKRSNFVSDASHELKTPLASIKLLTDSILQNEMDRQTMREFVQDIGNEADRLNRMSQKLLSLSRIESQEDSDCEIILIRPTLERVIRMLQGTAEKNQIAVVLDTQQDCPILTLEDDLYQILFNLVENGIKYSITGGTVTIRLSRSQDNAVISVSDTGVGIPEDSLEHIFERFYRVDKARSRKSGGSGLGLSIVRNLVERNHGQISVRSTLGVGSEFTVTFPVFDVEAAE